MDSSPLRYVVLIDAVDILPALCGRVLTPPVVLEELSQPNSPEVVRQKGRGAAWLASIARSIGFSRRFPRHPRRWRAREFDEHPELEPRSRTNIQMRAHRFE